MVEGETLIESCPRVGVILCECGSMIKDGLDIEMLSHQTAHLPGVVYVHHEAYPCSKDGQDRLRQAVQEHGLERVLVAGCAPRLVEKVFVQALQSSHIEPGYLMIANIREQSTFVHMDDPQAAYRTAMSIIAMGVARLTVTHAAVPHLGRVKKAALVIGSSQIGLSAALALAERGAPVSVIESDLKTSEALSDLLASAPQYAGIRAQMALNPPMINLLPNTSLVSVSGHPGDYEAWVRAGGQTTSISAGAIIVANVSRPKELGSDHWFDRTRVKTQTEFETELEQASQTGAQLKLDHIVMILCAEESQRTHCSRVCCNTGIRQAVRVKQLNPDASVTVLFRDLYLGGTVGPNEAELVQARKMGVTFFRYQYGSPPVIGDKTIDVQDPLTGEPVCIAYDRVVLSMPLIPIERSKTLAALLGLPQDEYGFLAEPRVRLRPGRYVDSGIYVLGSAQQPAETAEALFQAYLTSARALRFLNQDVLRVESPVAEIDANLCTGCGNCPQVCPVNAVTLQQGDGVLSLSTIDELRCIGCGNCVVVCPVKAISLAGWDNVEIPAQINAALDETYFRPGQPKILVLACEWSAYGAAEATGHKHISYPDTARVLRLNCSARFDPYHILWAFLNGADGVLLGACQPGECHYGMGNLYARERVEILQQELAQHGIDPRRLRLEFLRVQDGENFARIIKDFEHQVENEMIDRGRMPTGIHIPIKTP
jgi:heterodisulfide reductase subunit A2